MNKDENRLNFRMKPETAQKLEHWYKADHCRSRNEFVEKAVNFYADALTAEIGTVFEHLWNFFAAQAEEAAP